MTRRDDIDRVANIAKILGKNYTITYARVDSGDIVASAWIDDSIYGQHSDKNPEVALEKAVDKLVQRYTGSRTQV